MGFGLLLFGYAATYHMSFNSFGFFFRLIGIALMFRGLEGLSAFEHRFKLGYYICLPLALFEAVEAVVFLIGSSSVTDKLQAYAGAGFWIASVFFHAALFSAVYLLSKDVGLMSIAKRSIVGVVFLAVEIILILLSAVISAPVKLASSLMLSVIVFGFIAVIYNLVLFFSCYKNICEEGSDEAPMKYSRIPFLNKLLESSEKRETEIYNKTRAYAESKIREDNEKKRNKKKR